MDNDLLEDLKINFDKPDFEISCLDVCAVDRMYQDIAESYRVYITPHCNGGCIVYGLYNGNWKVNPSSQRYLIKKLVDLTNFK